MFKIFVFLVCFFIAASATSTTTEAPTTQAQTTQAQTTQAQTTQAQTTQAQTTQAQTTQAQTTQAASTQASGATGASGATDTSPGGDCVDKITDCKAYECAIPEYKPLMCSMCKKTCNFCVNSTNGIDPCAGIPTIAPPPVTAGPGDCIDTADNCATTAYECTNALYKPIMCKYCKKTCSLCNDPLCSSAFDESSSDTSEFEIMKFMLRKQ